MRVRRQAEAAASTLPGYDKTAIAAVLNGKKQRAFPPMTWMRF